MCNYLNQHPDIFIPEIKELNYFGSDLTGIKHAKTREKYLKFYEGNNERLCGDGSVWYLFSKTAAQEIHVFNLDAKIIIMLRNPIDYKYSLHSQALYVAFEDIKNFKLALEAEGDRKAGKRIFN